MSKKLEASIAMSVDALRGEGFEQIYIDAAVNAYRENLQHERDKAAEHGVRIAISPLSKITSVSSVDDPSPKESIGWQYRVLHQHEAPPADWIAIDD